MAPSIIRQGDLVVPSVNYRRRHFFSVYRSKPSPVLGIVLQTVTEWSGDDELEPWGYIILWHDGFREIVWEDEIVVVSKYLKL
tara:strand:- start:1033 stop:1281 length:249 start_codon:yes stop_codon:yes gene_type:complete